MKKVMVLLALVIFTSAISTVNSTNSTKSHAVQAGVPEAVQATFNNVVTDVMNNWYPGNNGWDASAVTWTREKGAWVATGDCVLMGGSGGITVVTSSFKNTGEFNSLNYNLLP